MAARRICASSAASLHIRRLSTLPRVGIQRTLAPADLRRLCSCPTVTWVGSNPTRRHLDSFKNWPTDSNSEPFCWRMRTPDTSARPCTMNRPSVIRIVPFLETTRAPDSPLKPVKEYQLPGLVVTSPSIFVSESLEYTLCRH